MDRFTPGAFDNIALLNVVYKWLCDNPHFVKYFGPSIYLFASPPYIQLRRPNSSSPRIVIMASSSSLYIEKQGEVDNTTFRKLLVLDIDDPTCFHSMHQCLTNNRDLALGASDLGM